MVGKGRVEEEPEGEITAGPSGEAIEQSSGNAPSFFFQNLITSSTTLPH